MSAMIFQIILILTLFCNLIAEQAVEVEARISPQTTATYIMAKKRCQYMGMKLWDDLTKLHPKFPIFKGHSENDLFWIDESDMHQAYKSQCVDADVGLPHDKKCSVIKFNQDGQLLTCTRVDCRKRFRFICSPNKKL